MYELLLFRGRDTIPPPTLEPRLSFGSGLNASGHRGALSPNTCTLEAALPEIGGAYYYQHLPARLQRAAVDGRRVFVALVDENWGDISSARPSRISSCAFHSHTQGSSGAVVTIPLVWRCCAKSPRHSGRTEP